MAAAHLSSSAPTPTPTPPPSGVARLEHFFANALHAISSGIAWLARLLHIPPSAVTAIIVILLLALLFLIIICCIRRCNRLPKNYKQSRTDVFDDVDLPDFDDEVGADACGFLTYSLHYSVAKSTLRIGLLNCTQLRPADRPSIDSYVVIGLVDPPPADADLLVHLFTFTSKTHRSAVVEHSLNPVFNEVLTLKVSLKQALTSWLLFDVYDRDLAGRDSNYGRVLVRFTEMDTSVFIGDAIEETARIVKSPQSVLGNGDLCLVLRYSTGPDSKEWLEVTVLEARDIRTTPEMVAAKGKVLVSVSVYKGRRKWKDLVSPQARLTGSNPYFNETFRFRVPAGFMSTGSIAVRLVYLAPPLGVRKTLGKLTFGYGEEHAPGARAHWKACFRSPTRPLARWHTM